MDQVAQRIAIALMAAGAVLLVWALIRRNERPTLMLCPGPSRWWRSVLSSLVRSGCRYDLTGLPRNQNGSVRCPECGRLAADHETIRWASRWRIGRIGSAVLVAAISIQTTVLIRTGHWVRLVPSVALVALERVGGRWQLRPLEEELRRRVHENSLPELPARLLVTTLVEDLSDDSERGNAGGAVDLLRILGRRSVGRLEAALESEDLQQRQLAAMTLWDIQNTSVNQRAVEVMVEGLADDSVRWNAHDGAWALAAVGERAAGPLERALDSGDQQQRRLALRALQQVAGSEPSDRVLRLSWQGLRNDAAGWASDVRSFEFLARHVERIGPLLAEGLGSDDYQQRFLCAVLAGFGAHESLIGDAAPLLIKHLKDNDIGSDAKLAAPALARFGQAVVPYLVPYRDSPDRQQRQTVELILAELGQSETPFINVRDRITNLVENPLAVEANEVIHGGIFIRDPDEPANR